MERRDPHDIFENLEEAADVFKTFCETIEPDSEAALATSHFLKITELEIAKEQLEKRLEPGANLDLVLAELALLNTEHTRLRIKPVYMQAYRTAKSQFEVFMEKAEGLTEVAPGIVIHRANLEFEYAITRHHVASPSEN